jgi:guanosine-3',5'-bis(diphosphate) 3'-pyrophosphohydrolase
VRQLIELLQNTEDPEEFLENTKLDLFKDQVFVFSPKGDVFALPTGATPLDFAYAIHSNIGNRCQAAKVNGRMVPLRTMLQTGDQVEVITSKTQVPNPGWREMVVSGRAKTAINRYLRAQELVEQIKLGQEILAKAAHREGVSVNEKDLPGILATLKLIDVDDLYAALAQGRLFPRQVFDALYPDRAPAEEPKPDMASQPSRRSQSETVVGIDGLVKGMAVHMAGCCHPLPGETIVGIINTGRGVTIHAKNCRNLDQYADQPDRWIPVKWGEEALKSANHSFQARLRVSLAHVPGALSNLSTAIFNVEGNIVDFHIENRSVDSFDIRCDVEVNNLAHFERMMTAIRNLKCVSRVERVVNG